MVGLTAWLEPGVKQDIAKHNAEAEQQMLAELRELDPEDFEQLVGELLRALGVSDVEVTQYHGDKGIDATGVYELAPSLVVRLAVQAKRQAANVGRPVVQALSGSLKPHQQGLIITTSDFGKGARDEAARDDKPLIWLITASSWSSCSSQTTSAPGASRSSSSSRRDLSWAAMKQTTSARSARPGWAGRRR